MRRRALLASGTSVLATTVAGCTGLGLNPSAGSSSLVGTAPAARLSMQAVTPAELPSKLLYAVQASEKARLLDRILDGGAAVDGTRPPLPADRHLLHDGTVYQLAHDVTARTPATRYSVKVDIVEGPVDESETVRFSDLPKVDRETFAEKGLANGETVGIGTAFLYTDAERNRSALVPESDYSVIRWKDGSRAKWVVDEAHSATVDTYQYTGERIAPAAEYGRRVRERFAFELSGLSEAQREIVTTAVEESHYLVDSGETPPPALVSLARRFRRHEHPTALGEDGEGARNGAYLVRFDGTLYWTVLMVHDESTRTETRTA
ncbi:hypothetical protein [Haladaptatus salinisoli]|uniref:hypothetical protein n=1 Tax=Haladaptatus salinisoli TaxID=2884876 RepID=UPI001D0ACCA5|nr:hypothetical protein [Haladaptatus salinisoli]